MGFLEDYRIEFLVREIVWEREKKDQFMQALPNRVIVRIQKTLPQGEVEHGDG